MTKVVTGELWVNEGQLYCSFRSDDVELPRTSSASSDTKPDKFGKMMAMLTKSKM